MSERASHPMVIPRRLVEATCDATEIVAAAKRQADDTRNHAFREGFAAGMQAAKERLADMERAIENYWSEREQELVSVALAVAHRIISELPSRERLAGQVKTALAAHRFETGLLLRTDPDTAAVLLPLLADIGDCHHVAIQSDPLLSRGSILLSHSQGQTEIGLVQQFRALLTEPDPRS